MTISFAVSDREFEPACTLGDGPSHWLDERLLEDIPAAERANRRILHEVYGRGRIRAASDLIQNPVEGDFSSCRIAVLTRVDSVFSLANRAGRNDDEMLLFGGKVGTVHT